MKKALLLSLFTISLISCTKNWEYKSVTLEGQSVTKYNTNVITPPDSCLNAMAKDNWELVSIYTTIETVHPNFGSEEYVTGLQPNTRTNSVVLIFKRQLNK